MRDDHQQLGLPPQESVARRKQRLIFPAIRVEDSGFVKETTVQVAEATPLTDLAQGLGDCG